jgi:hypothetical protein
VKVERLTALTPDDAVAALVVERLDDSRDDHD